MKSTLTINELLKINVKDIQPHLRELDAENKVELTQQYYLHQYENWKSNPAYPGSMSHHLIEDVHSHFRDGFSKLIAKGEMDPVAWKRIKVDLHCMHFF